MILKVINDSHHDLPEYKTKEAAAFDVQANLDTNITLGSLERAVVPTGLSFVIPVGFELQVRSRSGLPGNHGIIVGNSPGTIDSDYQGELKIILINASNESYTVEDGHRIAQVVMAPVIRAELVATDAHDELTERGSGGFGSTGD